MFLFVAVSEEERVFPWRILNNLILELLIYGVVNVKKARVGIEE